MRFASMVAGFLLATIITIGAAAPADCVVATDLAPANVRHHVLSGAQLADESEQ